MITHRRDRLPGLRGLCGLFQMSPGRGNIACVHRTTAGVQARNVARAPVAGGAGRPG
jgi:hypothetical protein